MATKKSKKQEKTLFSDFIMKDDGRCVGEVIRDYSTLPGIQAIIEVEETYVV